MKDELFNKSKIRVREYLLQKENERKDITYNIDTKEVIYDDK